MVSRTAEMVLDMYLAEPEVSLKRFELTRQVPSLRDKEITSIDQYQRVFARYLRQRFAEEPSGDLRAAVAAAAVVAAHNHVLRQWLKSGGRANARQMLRDALRMVRRALAASWQSAEEGDNAGRWCAPLLLRDGAQASAGTARRSAVTSRHSVPSRARQIFITSIVS